VIGKKCKPSGWNVFRPAIEDPAGSASVSTSILSPTNFAASTRRGRPHSSSDSTSQRHRQPSAVGSGQEQVIEAQIRNIEQAIPVLNSQPRLFLPIHRITLIMARPGDSRRNPARV
jgi:hypothetical protein